MKFKRLLLIPLFLMFVACTSSCAGISAVPDYSEAKVAVCFTPDGACTREIVEQINAAQKSIYMQGYSFTSGPIAYALIHAFKRGVDVKVILDKSNFNCSQFSFGGLLIRKGIPVWNDYTPSIAHSKIMIFDKQIVATGSFNFTKAAQYHNAENSVLIDSTAIAAQFLQNWHNRERVSKVVSKDNCPDRQYY